MLIHIFNIKYFLSVSVILLFKKLSLSSEEEGNERKYKKYAELITTANIWFCIAILITVKMSPTASIHYGANCYTDNDPLKGICY